MSNFVLTNKYRVMNDTWCNAYNNMPDNDNSMEALLYDQGYGIAIDTYLYYQVMGCDIIFP